MSLDPADLELIKDAIIRLATELKENEAAQAAKNQPKPLDESVLQPLLVDLLKQYQKKNEFKVGDLVKWKPGLQNLRFPISQSSAIVVEIMAAPVLNPIVDHGSPYFRELLDMRIGVVNDVGTLSLYMVQSARFMPA